MDLRVLVVALVAGCGFHLPGGGDDGGGGDGGGGDDGGGGVARAKLITIDPARVTGTHAHFPLWVVLDDPDLAAHASASGADIHFTDEGGAALPYELQRWKQDSGRLEAWVRVDLSSATRLVVRYGAATTATPDAAAVFDNGFASVWHLEDTLATPAVADATGQTPGTTAGGLTAAAQGAAQLGGGIAFDGGDHQIDFTNPLLGAGPHTISAWVNAGAPTDTYDAIVTLGDPGTRQSRWFFTDNFANNMAVGLYGDDFQTGNTVVGQGWTLVHWVYESGQSHVFRDGSAIGTFNHGGAAATTGQDGYLGWGPMQWGAGGVVPVGLNGTLDEVRIARVARSADWIAAEHANQVHPTPAFYTVGAEQTLP